jgi:hypothetical protein
LDVVVADSSNCAVGKRLGNGVVGGFGFPLRKRPLSGRHQQVEIRKMVSKGDKTAADAARLFKIHPATVSRLLARTLPSALGRPKHAK